MGVVSAVAGTDNSSYFSGVLPQEYVGDYGSLWVIPALLTLYPLSIAIIGKRKKSESIATGIEKGVSSQLDEVIDSLL